jgi:hypothetical protein
MVFAATEAICESASEPEMFASVEVAAAYTLPLASTPRPEELSPVNHCVPTVCLVVEALVEEAVSKMEVEEAMREIGEPVR